MTSLKRPPILLLLSSVFLFGLSLSLVFPVLPFIVARYVADSGRQSVVIGLLAATTSLLAFFGSPVLGALSDAFGRRPVILLALLGSAFGYLLFGIGGSLAMLFLGRAVDGVAAGGMGALFAYIADSTDEKHRARAFGQVGATVGVAMILGPAVGGLLAHFGTSAPVFVAAGVTLLNVLWVLLALPETLTPDRRRADFQVRHLNPLLQLKNALSSPPVRRLVTVSALFTLPFSLMQVALPIMARDLLRWGPEQVGTVLMLVGGCDIVAQGFLLPFLVRALGEGRVARMGLALGVIGMVGLALLPLHPLALLLYLSVLLLALGEGVYTACMTSLVSLAIPDSEQGRVQGGAQAVGELAQVAGPLLSGQLYARLGPAATFAAGAAAVALALGLLLGVRTPRGGAAAAA